jgi:hypothetical protein
MAGANLKPSSSGRRGLALLEATPAASVTAQATKTMVNIRLTNIGCSLRQEMYATMDPFPSQS